MKTKKNFTYENIDGIHLELTTKCNAMCPMCNRNFKGKVRKDLPIIELSLEDIRKILDPVFLKQIKLISLCGVYGEPTCCTDIKEIIKYILDCNKKIEIDLYTNGGLYDDKWWSDLANVMGPTGTVIFGIDGIGDVHSKHRCNTKFEKVIANAKAFIKNGGNANWDYIVFKHNEHQVDEARKLSEELGFKVFQIKKTSRFFKTLYEMDPMLDSTILDYGKHPVFDCNGNISYYLELPENPIYRNKSEDIIFDNINKYGTYDNYLDNNSIDCSAIKSGGIFISADGEVFPCCTIYQQVCYKKYHGVTDENELNEYKLYEKDDLSAFNHKICDIVNGKFFNGVIKSFDCKSIKCGKFKSCSRTCGRDLRIHENVHSEKIKKG